MLWLKARTCRIKQRLPFSQASLMERIRASDSFWGCKDIIFWYQQHMHTEISLWEVYVRKFSSSHDELPNQSNHRSWENCLDVL